MSEPTRNTFWAAGWATSTGLANASCDSVERDAKREPMRTAETAATAANFLVLAMMKGLDITGGLCSLYSSLWVSFTCFAVSTNGNRAAGTLIQPDPPRVAVPFSAGHKRPQTELQVRIVYVRRRDRPSPEGSVGRKHFRTPSLGRVLTPVRVLSAYTGVSDGSILLRFLRKAIEESALFREEKRVS